MRLQVLRIACSNGGREWNAMKEGMSEAVIRTHFNAGMLQLKEREYHDKPKR